MGELFVHKRLASREVGDLVAGRDKRCSVKNEGYLGKRPVFEDSENKNKRTDDVNNEVYLGKRPVIEESENKKKRRRRRPGRHTSFDVIEGNSSHSNQAGHHQNIPLQDGRHSEAHMRSSEGLVK